MAFTKQEMECVLIYSESSKKWEAYTNIPKYMRKFEKQGWKKTREIHADGEICGMEFMAPANAVTIRAPSSKRTLSDEQKQKLVEGRKKT